MKSAINIIKEQFEHFYLIRRLSLYELKSRNKSNYLGMGWEVLNPMIQILIYWFVFGTLLRRTPVEVGGQVVPFISWLVAAFFLWIFFYQSTIQGSKSIYSRLKILSKMNFPMSIIPSFVIFSQLYIHLFLLIITMILLNFMGYFVSIYYIQLIYYVFALLSLIFSISLITSTLSTIIRDIHMFINSTLRMFLYVSGVLWPLSLLKDFPTIMKLMQFNPLYYLVDGYRAALFGVEWHFIANWEMTVVFWTIVTILLLIGASLHMKFRKHFIDYL
ncbi:MULTISPECIES: ABC transporter permease [Allobacillus]|uniref:Transport permease protein n=1 Tax=Allobacillus salarius TaxID=1955272 RepID=A0A556PMT6_9BACI|nr:ABC transporter permease [Allobacillus salarius]TSJ65658.1 ABC transporter permease [Allobacillus salarius]